ncbi:hypothetical protein HID58_062221, partial [Brassica napus]
NAHPYPTPSSVLDKQWQLNSFSSVSKTKEPNKREIWIAYKFIATVKEKRFGWCYAEGKRLRQRKLEDWLTEAVVINGLSHDCTVENRAGFKIWVGAGNKNGRERLVPNRVGVYICCLETG